MKKRFLLFIGAGFILSCHKDQANPTNNWNWFGTENNAVYNYVLINANQVIAGRDTNEFHIAVTAAFIDSNSNRIYGINNLSVNNKVISPDVDSVYNYDYGSAQTLNDGLALYGTNVRVMIHGISNDDTVTKMVYLPKKLNQLFSNYPDTVSLSEGVAMRWSPDLANTWGNVQIQVYYYASLSQKSDSALPQKISTANITVPDNGSYQLTEQDLHAFPARSYIGISIARGAQNEAVLPVSRRKVYYFTSASLSSTPLFVIK